MKRHAEMWGEAGESIEIASRAQETKIRGTLIIWELKPYCYCGACNQSSCCSCQTEASQSVLLWQCGEMQPDELTSQNQHHGQRLHSISVSQLWNWRCRNPSLGFYCVFHSIQSVIFINTTSNNYFHYWWMYQLFSTITFDIEIASVTKVIIWCKQYFSTFIIVIIFIHIIASPMMFY